MEIMNVAATLTATASPIERDRTDSACVHTYTLIVHVFHLRINA